MTVLFWAYLGRMQRQNKIHNLCSVSFVRYVNLFNCIELHCVFILSLFLCAFVASVLKDAYLLT